MNYTHIFWDWNGTLLNDVDYCIVAVNRSLKKRNMEPLTKERYYKIFRFPIKDYYVTLGFDFEKDPYTLLADEYTAAYVEKLDEMPLQPHAKEVLAVFRSKNLPQYILSASEKNILERSLDIFNIKNYFSELLCTDNYLAEGKISYGKKFAETLPENSRLLLIGDTEHDLETANAIGADCVLFSAGHSSKEKLSSLGVPVIDDLHELYPIVFGASASKNRVYKTSNPDSEELRSYDTLEAEKRDFKTKYKEFYDDLKNTNKTEDW